MDIILALAASTHLNSSIHYNSIHPHLRIQQNNVVAGVFGNSVENSSFYLALNHNISNSLSIDYGITTGYDFALLVPMISINQAITENVSLFIIPSIETHNNIKQIIIATGLEVKF